MMIAQVAAVHTTGINWQSIGVILTGVAITGGFIAYLNRSLTTRITAAVTGLSDSLEGKLETKDTVTAINIRLTAAELLIQSLRERERESDHSRKRGWI